METVPSEAGFLRGGGEVGALIRNYDWSKTAIGPLSQWPQSLKSVTSLLLLSPIPMVLLWGEDGVMIYNDAYSKFAGNRHPDILGSKVREGWPEVADFNDNVMRVGLGGGTLAYRGQELALERHGDLEPAWMNLDYSPVLDETGSPAGVIAIVVEITEQILAERAVRDSEAQLRALVKATNDVLYRMTPDWRRMHQLDEEGLLTNSGPTIAWKEAFLFPEDMPYVEANIQDAVARKGPLQFEHRVRRPDGSAGWVFSRATPLFNAEGEITEWFGAATDVTERRRADQHLRLVVNELNHRVKNNLAMTQAIATQTFRSADNIAQVRDDFTSRIIALAQANDLLTGERWVGVSLEGVVKQATKPHAPDPDRCVIGGPELQLTPKTALAIAMAKHELATNAMKYGAWSNEAGKVTVTWTRYSPETGGDRLRLEWRESGGPPVATPKRRGFGSRLIERGLAAELGGEVKMNFEPDGLVCVVDAPLTVYADE
jgi:PAS domain S-box-containing protein